MGVDDGVRAGGLILAEDEVDNILLAHRHAAHTLDRQVRSAGREASAGDVSPIQEADTRAPVAMNNGMLMSIALLLSATGKGPGYA